MISQQGTSTLGSLKQGTRRWRRVAGGALLAVAVVGAIGVWQVRERSTPSTASREVVASTAAAVHGSAGATSTSGPAASFLYLVDSWEEQAFIQGLTGSLDQSRRERNEQPVRTTVLVGSTLDRAALEQLPGTSGTLIVDLRAPVPTAPATDAPTRELEALTAAGLGVPLAP